MVYYTVLYYLVKFQYGLNFQLEKLVIGHDNRGQDPAWFLDEVDIDIPVRDEHYKFRCGGWLGGADPGQRKETVLFPGNNTKIIWCCFNIGRHYQNRALRGDTNNSLAGQESGCPNLEYRTELLNGRFLPPIFPYVFYVGNREWLHFWSAIRHICMFRKGSRVSGQEQELFSSVLFIQILRKEIVLYWLPTRPPFHVFANKELSGTPL